MSGKITLYSAFPSRGMVVHWMLEEIGCDYEIVELEYGPAMRSPEYLALNPMGKSPTLVHNGVVVTETPAICAYLADVFPDAGLAPSLSNRADYYRWFFFAVNMENALFLRASGFVPSEEMRRRIGFGTCEHTLDVLAAHLRGRSYVAGDNFSAADVYIASLLDFSMRFKTLEEREEFTSYVAPLVARPAAKRANEQAAQIMSKRTPA